MATQITLAGTECDTSAIEAANELLDKNGLAYILSKLSGKILVAHGLSDAGNYYTKTEALQLIQQLIAGIDFSNYNTKDEVAEAISTAIASCAAVWQVNGLTELNNDEETITFDPTETLYNQALGDYIAIVEKYGSFNDFISTVLKQGAIIRDLCFGDGCRNLLVTYVDSSSSSPAVYFATISPEGHVQSFELKETTTDDGAVGFVLTKKTISLSDFYTKDETDALVAEKTVAITDLDTLTDIPYSGVTSRYVVISPNVAGTVWKNVGVLDVFTDDSIHLITQVFTTHEMPNDDGVIDGNKHNDNIVYQYVRHYKVKECDLDGEIGEWSAWTVAHTSADNAILNAFVEEDPCSKETVAEMIAEAATGNAAWVTNNLTVLTASATEDAIKVALAFDKDETTTENDNTYTSFDDFVEAELYPGAVVKDATGSGTYKTLFVAEIVKETYGYAVTFISVDGTEISTYKVAYGKDANSIAIKYVLTFTTNTIDLSDGDLLNSLRKANKDLVSIADKWFDMSGVSDAEVIQGRIVDAETYTLPDDLANAGYIGTCVIRFTIKGNSSEAVIRLSGESSSDAGTILLPVKCGEAYIGYYDIVVPFDADYNLDGYDDGTKITLWF
ncbi:MAG: hypothetical protein LUC22_01300 [Prevotella sp.]|nr:hypothetical protein [Prevotella sp.]